MNPNTVILLFTRDASEKAANKLLYSKFSKHQNRLAFQYLISHAFKEAEKNGITVYHCLPENQQGNTFGEKFSLAFQELYQKGFDNVIAVGNDCPELNSELLQDASQNFKKYGAVLGPAKDSGTYLIGINKKYFCREKFANTEWQKSCVFNQLLKKNKAFVEILPVLHDIDHESDLSLFLRFKFFKQQLLGVYHFFKSLIINASLKTDTMLSFTNFILSRICPSAGFWTCFWLPDVMKSTWKS